MRITRGGEQIGPNRIANFVEVLAPVSECTWEASTDTPWITINGATRKGNGQVDYEVLANDTSDERRGSVQVGDKVFDVFQAGNASVTGSDTGGGGGDGGGDGGGGSGGGDGGG